MSGDSTTTKEASNSPQTSATSPTGPSSPTATATPSEDAASTPAGPVVTALLKEADSLRGQDIPRFYFPDTGRVSSAAPVDDSRLVQALDEIQGQTVTLAQMADIAKAMGYPKFWKQPLFSAAGGTEQRPAAKDRLLTLRRELTKNFRDDSSRFVHLLTRGARQHLVSDDFLPLVQDIVDSHPGLSFLQEAPEFHGRYVNTVIARIFYEVNASWTGRITCQELRRSKLLATIASLELKDDINEVTDFFSYEHFYVIYCKFWDIDTDHDLFISKEDLRRHNNYALSDRIIDRIFSGAVSRNKSLLTESRMSYPDFVWFLLAEEDKRHPRSIEYWFRCMDLDGDGVISLYEMEYFYTEQMRRMEEARIEEYQGLQDCVCTMLDMVKPAQPNRIALGDLKRCKLAGVFFDTMFNLHKFLDYEQRDPFANLRDIQECAGMSDWEKYAAEMYEILVAEESNGAMHDDAAYADDFENMEEDPAENFRSGEGLKFLESFKGSKEI
ncbi:hypothetical protein BOX15_Mlig023791g4 [Macrostomum lignano]|uniref:EF-hand domain-containing protein n=1 Tax=Macrostomum lignano TaxID=282301 RepID=A0A267DD28_9PLAT|nr:hypothetical protein BOX15_Mlig023791g4 [Macrostomum lignano]